VVVGVVTVPAGEPLTTGLVMTRSYRALLDFLPSEVEVGSRKVRVDRVVKVARDVAAAVREAAREEGADLVLLHWKGYARRPGRHTFGRITDAILRRSPCDVLLVRPEGWRDSRRIVLPVRGGPSAERALTMALTLARHLDVPLSVMHTVPAASPGDRGWGLGDGNRVQTVNPDRPPLALIPPAPAETLVEAKGEEPYIVFNDYLKSAERTSGVRIERILTAGGDPASSLLAEARQSDLVILGTPAPGRGHGAAVPVQVTGNKSSSPVNQIRKPGPATWGLGEASGPVARRVSDVKGPPLMVLHVPEPVDMARYRRQVRARRDKQSWEDMPFEHWFVENTFHGDEFRDPEAFLEAKRRSGLTISVAMLTSNDAAHIYSALVGLKKVLVEMHPIADQLVIVDAGSTDGTVDIARSLGVEVYSCADLLPDKGNLHGRGESWWKSLAALRGDLLVWLDPRAQRFHPSTAMSLAGPLLRLPTMQFVKAYGQPQQAHQPSNGHRLTGKHKNGNGHNGNGHGNGSGSGHGPGHARAHVGSPDYAPVDMSWGGFVIPGPGPEGTGHGRIRVQALRPEDLLSLDPAQIAGLPPRSILQVLCPSLAGVIAPFSRDMAGRREAMLSLPVLIGDNAEVGLLLSVVAGYGTRSIAQVELRHAMPAPPPQPGLRHALDLTQVLSRRLQDPTLRGYAAEIASRLQKHIEGGSTRALEDASAPVFEVRALGPVERPPMGPLVSNP
jgi:nucleotide-binding universal stress UspA family protein